MLKLVKPSKRYLKSFLKIIDDYQQDPNLFKDVAIKPLMKAISENKIDEYFNQINDYSKGKNLPDGYVPSTTFWLINNTEFVGTFVIRHCLTAKLEQWGGHIAANIAPKYRGRYSSFIGIKMCLAQACKLGLKRVLMTCNENNSASYRAITGLMKLYGGKALPGSFIDGHGEHRVWINTTKN
jgi:predicted acetyltransferase